MTKELTEEQKSKIPEYRLRWTNFGLNCEPANRAEGEKFALMAYESISAPHPHYVVWFESPLMGAFAGGLFADPDKGAYTWIKKFTDPYEVAMNLNEYDAVDISTWGVINEFWNLKPGSELTLANAWKSLWIQLCNGALQKHSEGRMPLEGLALEKDGLTYTVGVIVDAFAKQGVLFTQAIAKAIGQLMWNEKIAPRADAVESQGRQKAWDACYGSHDASWLGFYEFFRDEVGYEKCNELNGLIGAAKTMGWFWPFESLCIATDRHCKIALDERERLSCLDGPAVEYRDGFKIWAANGVQIPARFIEKKDELTVDDVLKERNQEVRRILLSYFYPREKFLKEINATVVAEDKFGKLWRGTTKTEDGADLTISAVEVLNGSLEKDGTRRTYFLGCLNTHMTPREAVAWSYHLTAEEYDPVLRT